MASQQWRANQQESALLWAIPSLGLPVTFGHITACRSPALAFAAAIHFVPPLVPPVDLVGQVGIVDSDIPFARKHMISVLPSDAVRPNAAHTITITPIIFISCSGDCETAPASSAKSMPQSGVARTDSPAVASPRLFPHVELAPNRVMGEMVLDGGGHFIPAGIFGLHTLSLLLSSKAAHDRATEGTRTHTGDTHTWTQNTRDTHVHTLTQG